MEGDRLKSGIDNYVREVGSDYGIQVKISNVREVINSNYDYIYAQVMRPINLKWEVENIDLASWI